MSIISQIGVVILIAFIVLVLIRSNKNLKKASEEGENFVDEWALLHWTSHKTIFPAFVVILRLVLLLLQQ